MEKAPLHPVFCVGASPVASSASPTGNSLQLVSLITLSWSTPGGLDLETQQTPESVDGSIYLGLTIAVM